MVTKFISSVDGNQQQANGIGYGPAVKVRVRTFRLGLIGTARGCSRPLATGSHLKRDPDRTRRRVVMPMFVQWDKYSVEHRV